MKVKYFGRIAEITGTDTEDWEVNETLPIAVLDEQFKAKYPLLHFESYQIAQNQQFNGPDTAVQNSDEIALLPPFGGG